jgi:hypothetical protein
LASWRETKEASMTENAIATEIVDAAFRIHTTFIRRLAQVCWNRFIKPFWRMNSVAAVSAR